jgi:hypothetical protein
MTAVIPPGKRAIVTVKPRTAFRPERVVISAASFPLSRRRRVWTKPLVVIGSGVGRAHRALARLLRVDLHAPREQREYIDGDPEDDEYRDAIAMPGDYYYDDDEDRYYRETPLPLNRRERFLAPIGNTARRLSGVRVRWQQEQLGTLLICQITIAKQPMLADAGPLPADMFSTSAIDNFLDLGTCTDGHEIAIAIENTNRRECRLAMALIGTTASDHPGRR